MTSSEIQREAWDRRPDENTRQYEAFRLYYSIPPLTRSITAAYLNSKGGQLLLTANRRSGRSKKWFDWANRFEWRERASTYDIHLERKRRQKREEQMFALEEARWQHEQKRHAEYVKEVDAMRAEIEKILAMPRTDYNETQYNDDGTIKTVRKIRGIRPGEIAQLRREMNDTDRIATHGHFKITKSMRIEEDPDATGNPTGGTARLELNLPDFDQEAFDKANEENK